MSLDFFKAYDVRGKLGSELNNDMAYRIGRAYAQWLKPERVVIGGDIRHSSMVLKSALSQGLRAEGVNVEDIGLCGTEEIYFVTANLNANGGIMVTASHNPMDYNGMKFVREQSRPISGDTGLQEIAQLVENNKFDKELDIKGSYTRVSCFDSYLQHLLTYIDISALKPLKLLVNPGNGAAGPVLEGLENKLPFHFEMINFEPDGSFPNGIPNPLLIENRHMTADAVVAHKADIGIAWDGDFDRCFFFDHQGRFIEGYYIVGLLAEAFLRKNPGEKIIHDPRLTWNTLDVCETFGGQAVQSKCGHAFIKETMREQDAIYGGEMSAHHYFRNFFYCDSGMIPWLLIAELLSTTGKTLAELVEERMAKYPCSGEINRQVEDAAQVINKVEKTYVESSEFVETVDGLSMSFDSWRFNLRSSNTEPVIRLNVEATSQALMEKKTKELLLLIK